MDRRDRDQFFEDLAEDFARLRDDPAASAEYDADLAAWDGTLLDGLAEYPCDETAQGEEKPTQPPRGVGGASRPQRRG